MKSSKVKRIALAALMGGTMLGGGCLGLGGGGWWGRVLWDAAVYTGLEWATDNDAGLIDLWEDGDVTVADTTG